MNAQKPETKTPAFTLIELAAVLGVAALLAAMTLPAMCHVAARSTRAQCMGNLRQLVAAIEVYASQGNSSSLPNNSFSGWAWDVYIPAVTPLLTNGATRANFYCPGFPEMNNNFLWGTYSYRVLGYVMTFPGTASLITTNYNYSLAPTGTLPGAGQPASQRVLAADSTISLGNNEVNRSTNGYVGIQGGWSQYHRTAHLEGLMPAGGNLGMVDGHVEWRRFQDMHVRTTNSPNITPGVIPYFWW